MANVRKLIERARPLMEPGERVLSALLATYETKGMGGRASRRGVMMATDRRLVFYAKKRLRGHTFEVLTYVGVSSVEHEETMDREHVTIRTGGGLARLTRIRAGDAAHFAGVVREQIGEEAPAAAPAPPDFAELLRKLKELQDAGVLTAEEFEAKKADVLSRV